MEQEKISEKQCAVKKDAAKGKVKHPLKHSSIPAMQKENQKALQQKQLWYAS